MIDESEIRRFLTILHRHAAALAAGHSGAGVMQLICIFPDGKEQVSVSRFRIGEDSEMAQAAIDYANAGHNVYCETRIVRPDLRGKQRGDLADTRFAFAFVIDNDADRGKVSPLSIEASIIVETSPGNEHRWLLLDRPLGWREAAALGASMRAAIKADSCSCNIVTPFRVSGTPTFPTPNKKARGRVAVATRILEISDRRFSADELRAMFPPLPIRESQPARAEIIDHFDYMVAATAIRAIPNPGRIVHYDDWLCVMMALTWAAKRADCERTADRLYELADSWSQRSVKYDRRRQQEKWRDLMRRDYKGDPTTLRTIYKWAQEYGWIAPDGSGWPAANICNSVWRNLAFEEICAMLIEDREYRQRKSAHP